MSGRARPRGRGQAWDWQTEVGRHRPEREVACAIKLWSSHGLRPGCCLLLSQRPPAHHRFRIRCLLCLDTTELCSPLPADAPAGRHQGPGRTGDQGLQGRLAPSGHVPIIYKSHSQETSVFIHMCASV